MGRALRTTLPTSRGGVVHFLLFMVIRVWGMLINCSLLIGFVNLSLLKLRWFVLVSPCLLLVILYAESPVIPCLAKGISAGRNVDLAHAYSLGAGFAPDATCRLSREDGTGSRGDVLWAVPVLLLLLRLVMLFTLHFSVLSRLSIGAWMADVASPVVCQPIWPACWLGTPDRSSSSSTRVV